MSASEPELTDETTVPNTTAPETMKVVELRAELKRRKLLSTGNKDNLVRRLKAALLIENEREASNPDDADGDGDEDDDDDDDEQPFRGFDNRRQERSTKCLLTFKDFEDSIEPFNGDKKINVKKWLAEFEEMAKLCQWNDIQKIVYCRRFLKDGAKLFVAHAKCTDKWANMKKGLIKEFFRIVTKHDVYMQLSQRKKKNEETYQEYVYRMMEIFDQISMSDAAIIKYIIDGIQDDEVNKMILYGAKTLDELKEKLWLYEDIKKKSKAKARVTEVKTKDVKDFKGAVRKSTSNKWNTCYNCGQADHKSADCPSKKLGTKCFN